MASAIPRRAGRSRLRREAFGAVAQTTEARSTPVGERAAAEFDVFRLLAGVVGLTALVGVPGALLVWVAGDVFGGLAERLSGMLT